MHPEEQPTLFTPVWTTAELSYPTIDQTSKKLAPVLSYLPSTPERNRPEVTPGSEEQGTAPEHPLLMEAVGAS